MLSDKKAAELISKSLRLRLSSKEIQEIEEHVSSDSQTKRFAEISKMIQDSVVDFSNQITAGDLPASPGLSDAAKARMNDSVQDALQQKQSGSLRFNPQPNVSVDKEVMFAKYLIQSGHVTEVQVSRSLAEWSLDRSVDFGRFLVDNGMINDTQRSQAEAAMGDKGNAATVTIDSVSGLPISETDPTVKRISSILMESDIHRPLEPHSVRQMASKFSLLRKLGQGGLGTVWLARDERLRRNVAIKEMNSDAAESPKAWLRFHREAEITGYLEHPNVVPLYQFGTDAKNGQPFYAMRFVGKRTLADSIVEFHEKRESGFDCEIELHRLLNVFMGVCQAIAYAHSRGVIHRDLKPENVALDNFGQVIVLDWGLAKLTNEAELGIQSNLDTNLQDSSFSNTMAGEVVGTPLYMAPEQAAGELDNVDAKTDVYGLGALLFAILTGSAPHEKCNLAVSDNGNLRVRELLAKIAEGNSPSPREFNDDVPRDLERICLKAMARKKYARHDSALDLAHDVETWMAGHNRKQQQYENMRIEARELCMNLQSAVRDLSTNARFMAMLPPIQGLIDSRSGTEHEDETVWRERLSTIFQGLLQANSNYMAVTYSQVNENYQEIVRVERHEIDRSTLRSVPLSRLESGTADDFVTTVLEMKPQEVHVHTQQARVTHKRILKAKILAGVPVFDERTEDPFGVVTIECHLHQILEGELRQRVRTAKQVLVTDADWKILLHESKETGSVCSSIGTSAEKLVPDIQNLGVCFESKQEYLDQTDREFYISRVTLGNSDAGLRVILLLN